MLAELVSLKADTQFIPPLKDVGFLAQFLANKTLGDSQMRRTRLGDEPPLPWVKAEDCIHPSPVAAHTLEPSTCL